MKAKALLALLMFCTWSTGFSQQSDTVGGKTWTLRECVEYALANNLQVKRSELSLELSSIDKRQAKLALLPSANAFSSYGYNWGRGIDPVTNQFISSQRNGYTSIGASGDLDLFNGFRLQNNIRQSATEFEASEEDLAKTRNDVSLNVVSLFVNVVFNKELLGNAELQLSSSRQQLERTQRLVAAGSLPKSEELNLTAQVATNELNVINQENALNLSLLQLQQALQLPAQDDFDVEVPDLTAEDLVLDQTRDEIFQVARGTMPEIESARLRIESSRYGVKAARGNLYPRLSISGSVSKFNYVVALAKVGGKEILMDATDPLMPLGQLPRRCLNGQGWIVAKNSGDWVALKSTDRTTELINADLLLLPTGVMSGKVSQSSSGLWALNQRHNIQETGEEKYLEKLTSIQTQLERRKPVLQNLKELHKPFGLQYEVASQDEAQAKDIIYLNPMLLKAKQENPFKHANRKYPVDFAHPTEEVYVCSFTIPEGYAVEEMPKSITLILPENGGRFTYMLQNQGNKIQVMSKLSITRPVFYAKEYEFLQEFYTQMVAKHAEQIVLKKKG